MSNVIAEIGLNHGGDLNVVKQLIRQSKDSGCWGVKFQYRDIESFYENKFEVSDVIIYDEIKKNYISIESLLSLAQFCKGLNIKFGISVFRVRDLKKLDVIVSAIDFFKIPSAECLNNFLLEEILKRNKKVFVSTGAHETDRVISSLEPYKNKIILLHCISNYPSLLGTQDMLVISRFKSSGFVSVGYSSHDNEWEVCLIALAQGAEWIERHITLSKDENGLDHSSSSVFDEFVKLVKFSQEYQDILGTSNHRPNQGELINLQNLGTSLYAKRNLKTGEKTTIDDYDIRAPRIGISPSNFLKDFETKALQKSVIEGQCLMRNNYFPCGHGVSSKIRNFARNKDLGVPVRLHDYSFLRRKFDIGTYEFHLSFAEALSGDFEKVLAEVDAQENISIHLPDYIPGNNLIDPISRNKEIKSVSRKLINKVAAFALKIEDKVSRPVNIIGSFSKGHNLSREINLNEIFDYIKSVRGNILPQWLPVYAWYFGGSVKLNLFNSDEDIKYLTSNRLKICLDVSHLVMASSYYKVSWKSWYEKLLPCVEHIHISDAADSTSEGLMFGDGVIGDFSDILSVNKLKIIECWQGHINEGEGFQESLEILYGQSQQVERSNAKK